MVFADDSTEALRSAVWLVNSAEDPSSMTDAADEDAFLSANPYTGRIDRDEDERMSLRALRPRLRAMLLAPRDEMAARVNEALADVTLALRLTRHGELDWHLHAVKDEAPLAERVLIETAMALIDVIRADEGSRIAVCADDTCQNVALDLSRNRAKRYCSTTCANRNAVAAYRARNATGR